ncbi:MAG: VWA domain-containing protein [Candidatus Mcinerneyibacterium aminivorans]|uniref:VWA domain-containing protein n=1 Tax=Candidatus Mcinerneyibacterium aminivorans TaxID=2703815 RepID=A0A5D0ME76_9BACT|nr:MAG: VWA domain-containing protein [Candidatus Mcinerneyibacterium aminivorans]
MHWAAFEHIYLLIIPVFFVAINFFLNKKRMKVFDKYPHFKNMFFPKNRFRKLKFVLFISAMIFIILALMKPRWGIKNKEIKQKGYDIIIALDTSKSMLAKDLKPDRLTRAKKSISELVDYIDGSKLSYIAFAGVSRVVVPLTHDYNYIKNAVSATDTDEVSLQGTNFKDLIEKTVLIFSSSEKERFLILLSDGEDHEGNLNSLIKKAKENNIHIYTIPVGTENGSRIPVVSENNKITGFKKNKKGNYVISKTNLELMKKISSETGGETFYSSDIYSSLKKAIKSINSYSETNKSDFSYRSYKEKYHYFLLIGVLCLMGFVSLPHFKSIKIKVLLILILPIFMNFTLFDRGNILNNEAVDKYKEKKYTESLQKFKQAEKFSDDPALQYNIGNNLYKLKKYDDAMKHFESSISKLPKESLFNLGNSLYQMKKYNEAAKAYRKLLKKYPDFEKAKKNLELALKKAEEDKKKKKNNQKKNKNEKKDKNDKRKNGDEKKDSKKQNQNKDKGNNKQSEETGKKQDSKKQSKDQQKTSMKREVYDSLLENLRKKEIENLKNKQNEERRNKDGTEAFEKDW